MPFTLAHPAAVLPLRRTRLRFAALVIGSMIPDAQFYWYLDTRVRSWHERPGMMCGALLVGIIGYYLYQWLLAAPLRALLPWTARAAEAGESDRLRGGWGECAVVCLSVAIGLITHLAWDSCTHDHGLIWKTVASFDAVRAIDQRLVFPLYVFFQHGSTFLGFALMAWFLGGGVRAHGRQAFGGKLPKTVAAQWAGLLLIAVFACGFGWQRHDPMRFSLSQHELLRDAMVYALLETVRTGFAALCLWAVCWQILHRRRRPAVAPASGNPSGPEPEALIS